MDPKRFRFLDPGPLLDRELSLVAPSPLLIEDFLASNRHPDCIGDPECNVTRVSLQTLLQVAPGGRETFDPITTGCIGAYRLWMRLRSWPDYDPPLDFAGRLTLRIGNGENVTRYFGQIGYVVFPPARGRHLAERAVRLILPLAAAHGMTELWITTNPDNPASRRTCERLGANLVETVDIPRHHPLHARGERRKCRYRLEL